MASSNGTFIRGQRIETATVGIDEWIVVGQVLVAFREGLSLDAEGAVPPPPLTLQPERTTERNPPTEATRPDWADLLARALGQAHDIESRVYAVLGAVAQGYAAAGAALLESSGNGWIVHCVWGSPIPPGLDDVLDAAAPHRAVADCGMRVLCLPVQSRSSRSGWVVVYPWQRARMDGPEIQQLRAWCQTLIEYMEVGRGGTVDLSGARTPPPADGFVTVSETSRGLLAEVDTLASTDLNLLVLGETGVGKELIARRIHARSDRADGPFAVLNCSAIPRELFEAELFGIERGAATGVQGRAGHFVLASGGTLFLDEVGDLPLEVQPKLLRALESGEVLPVGAPAPVPTRVRVVSATHKDLLGEAKAGRFRDDLFYRLAGATLVVSPIRERPEDILPLARLFAKRAAGKQGRGAAGIDLEAARVLLGYHWPGNARELSNVIGRAVALATDSVIHADLLPAALRGTSDLPKGDALLGLRGDWRTAVRAFEKLYFTQLLDRSAGSVATAARLAGMNRTNLYKKLRELDLRESGDK